MTAFLLHRPTSTSIFHCYSALRNETLQLRRTITTCSPLDADNSSSPKDESKKKLFRVSFCSAFIVARPWKKFRSYENDKIDKLRAMAEFGLREEHLNDLPSHPKEVKSASLSAQSSNLYSLTDVYHKALKIHGSEEAVDAQRRPLVAMSKELTDAERMRMRMRVESTSVSKGADRVVAIAFTLNACDAAFKYVAAYLTGSKSLFAEAIHSTMDTCNQLILLMGIRFSAKNPDNLFPYGYGNMRYVTSLISGCGIMAFGCGLSIYHGVSGLLNPTELEPLHYAYYALFMSFCFQGTSAIFAYSEVIRKARRARLSVVNYVRTAADPSLNVVLLEDTAAVSGVCDVVIALCAVSLSSLLCSPIPDSIGSIVIGCLLGTVASFIIRTNAAHLVGRSLPKRITDDIVCRLNNDPVIRSVHDVKATALGVEQSRFKAELDFNGREITRVYLHKNVHMPTLLKEVKSLKDEKELEDFMKTHGEKIIDLLGDEIDRIEGEITKKHPDIRHVDLEAL
ncbi:cation diffusion facilitator family transporter [Dictyocaulus viviparus]|uniref:Proton-coupled zinc antiporter SLC30A9, mitochondrial n=1 Tax=Dictyocaulus viviparus TaxID=29172 RepID=A0A0D8YE38_DICVI|nr:cation diffusion facilitator family transporter [Dictyocaulus viviparus]